jgi:hypothetical protein
MQSGRGVLRCGHRRAEVRLQACWGGPWCTSLPCSVLRLGQDESSLLRGWAAAVSALDPELVLGWDVQRHSLGYLTERAQARRGGLVALVHGAIPDNSGQEGPHAQGADMLGLNPYG